jgi:phosphate transport system substrate-binding protein
LCDPRHSLGTKWSFPKMLICSLFVIIFVSSCAGSGGSSTQLSGTIQIDGSTALQPLATQAAEAFVKQNPLVHITVSGGGSFTGLTDVSNGKVQIGDSDVYASFAAYPNPSMTDHLVCVIPFTLVTNPDVQLPSLTHAQIRDIFSSNQLTNWKDVGGPDLPIVPIVRPSTSGTRDTFRKYVLGGRDEGTANQVLQKDSTAAVHDKVAQTPGAIGYLGLASVDDKVHPVAIDGKNATKDNIIAGSYTFWSYEHMYTLGDDNPVVSAFLDFMLSPTVRGLAQRNSYIPIGDMKLPQVGLTTRTAGISAPLVAWYRESQEREIN